MAEQLRSFVDPSGEHSPLGEGIGAIERELEITREQLLADVRVDASWDELQKGMIASEAGHSDVRDYQDWEGRVEECFQQNQGMIDRIRQDAIHQSAFLKAKLTSPDEQGQHGVSQEIESEVTSLAAELESQLKNQELYNEMALSNFRRKSVPREENWMDYRAAQAREGMLKKTGDALRTARLEYNSSWKFYKKTDPEEASVRLTEAKAKLEQTTSDYNKMFDQVYKGSQYSAEMDYSRYYAKLPDLEIPDDWIGSGAVYDPERRAQREPYIAQIPNDWALPDGEYWGTAGKLPLNDVRLIRKNLETAINDFYQKLEHVGVAQDEATEEPAERAMAA